MVDGALVPTSGPASGALVGPGTTLVRCWATDKHGDSATASFKVTVIFGWSGVLPPINPNGGSTFKQGSTIPVKFRLTETSAGIASGAFKLYWSKVTNSVAGTERLDLTGRVVKVVVLAGEGDSIAGPQKATDLYGLGQHGQTRRRRRQGDAVGLVLLLGPAGAEPQHEAAAADLVDRGRTHRGDAWIAVRDAGDQ